MMSFRTSRSRFTIFTQKQWAAGCLALAGFRGFQDELSFRHGDLTIPI